MTMFECGRPETLWQDVDAMWEADAAAEWERLNEPDPSEKALKEAAKMLVGVVESLDKATDSVAEAVNILEGTPMEDRVASIMDDLEDICCDVRRMQSNFSKGVAE